MFRPATKGNITVLLTMFNLFWTVFATYFACVPHIINEKKITCRRTFIILQSSIDRPRSCINSLIFALPQQIFTWFLKRTLPFLASASLPLMTPDPEWRRNFFF